MKRCWRTLLCVLFVGITTTGCTNRTVEKETSVSVRAMETDVSFEAVKTSKTYYQLADDDTISPLELVLFDDGTFGFTYIYLSTYSISGTYEQSEDRMIATTNGETYRLVFQVDGDRYIFL